MATKDGVIFDPVVGRLYGNSPLKLLILGESYYSWDGRPKRMAEVATAALGDGNYRFHLVIRKLLKRPEPFWDSVAFYNYVQCFVGDRARQRPTAEMWNLSHAAFGQILRQLQPDRILVIGKTTWLEMAGEAQDYPGCKTVMESRFKLGPEFSRNVRKVARVACWYETTPAKFALAAPVYHPAYPRGFHSEESRMIARRLMDPRWKHQP